MALMVPLADIIDPAEEKIRLQREIEKAEKEVTIFQKKLSNENFVSRAPEEVVAKEKEKLANAENSLEKLQQQLARILKH